MNTPIEEDLFDFTVRASRATTCETTAAAKEAEVGGEPALEHSQCAGTA